MIPALLRAGQAKLTVATALLLAVTVLADWAIGRNVSLATLYILPVMAGAVILRPVETLVLSAFCSYLRSHFEVQASPMEEALRFVFAFLAYLASGMFVTELVRNHKLAIEHLQSIREEQKLRLEAEEQLKVLVESSPAAIMTLDDSGVVLAANASANSLFAIPQGESLRGHRIQNYLPVLAGALSLDVGPAGLRTAAQCQATRANGEIFLAHTWFSSYSVTDGMRLAAIVVDASEEMREREEQGLRQLLEGNGIAAAAVAHEVRNFCSAITLLCSNFSQRPDLAGNEDLRGLVNLVDGLNSLASLDLSARNPEILQHIPLKEVLDNLRIVVEPDWRDIEGTVRWCLPQENPVVLAEPHGLLQAFLNLVQNSHRAVSNHPVRQLTISLRLEKQRAFVRFQDSGPGVAEPERLFQPFQHGAAGSGLGLYISRSIVRSYGGELRFEPAPTGCFVVELQALSS